MKKIGLLLLVASVSAALLAKSPPLAKKATKPKLAVSIKPKDVADALKAVITSDCEVYNQLLVEHSRADASAPSASALPAPCEVLRWGSQCVASKGVEFSYVLRSFQPVNPRNAPETEVEVKGLQHISTRPDLVYTADELLGGRWYFTAVYPDVAVSENCVACHNRLKPDLANPLREGDVIGALIIRIALEL